MSELQELPITPELYQATLEKLNLQVISLEAMSSDCKRDIFNPSEIEVNIGLSAEDRQEKNVYYVFADFVLEGVQSAQKTLSINARFRLTFHIDTPIPEGFFEVFKEVNLPLTAIPYFRELVASTTARMELPTLTLPYNIFSSAGQEQDEQETLKHSPLASLKGRRTTSSIGVTPGVRPIFLNSDEV